MRTTLRRTLMLVVLAVAGSAALTACSDDDGATGVVTTDAASLGGFTFSLTGATASIVAASFPAVTSGFAAPVVSADGTPSPTQARTITVSAAEPFTTVFLQPPGSASYVRVLLPAATTLIGIRVIGQQGATSVATSLSIAVGNGSRTSGASPLAFLLVPRN